jgi:membrane protease YdiL (CAAX protease family)
VAISSAFFAAAHPPAAFIPEFLLGTVLGAAFLGARGNLAAPVLGHAAYNAVVVAAAALLAAGGGQQGASMAAAAAGQ